LEAKRIARAREILEKLPASNKEFEKESCDVETWLLSSLSVTFDIAANKSGAINAYLLILVLKRLLRRDHPQLTDLEASLKTKECEPISSLEQSCGTRRQ
jgi:hypothetical protein